MLEYAEENDSVLFKTDPNPCLNDCLNKPASDASFVLNYTPISTTTTCSKYGYMFYDSRHPILSLGFSNILQLYKL